MSDITNADLTYLELTAKHAPQELGNEKYAKLILALIDFYEENESEVVRLADEIGDLEEQVTDLKYDKSELADRIDTLEGELEDLKCEIQNEYK